MFKRLAITKPSAEEDRKTALNLKHWFEQKFDQRECHVYYNTQDNQFYFALGVDYDQAAAEVIFQHLSNAQVCAEGTFNDPPFKELVED